MDDDPRLTLRRAVMGIPAMLRVALASENDSRELALRVGHIVCRLHSAVLEEFGEGEAEDMVGATLRLVRDRVTDIFGPDAWNEPRPAERFVVGERFVPSKTLLFSRSSR